MRHPISIATTPSTLPQAARKSFKIYYIVLQNYVDNIINKKKKASERRDREINIVTFMNATLDSKFIPDEVKTNFWVQKKIIKRSGEVEDNIQLFLNAANASLRALPNSGNWANAFQNDPDLDRLL